MISFPNAKINLGLDVLEKRSDGYHNISSCFYPVGWHDVLEIVPSDTFSMQITGLDVPGEATSNLCAKAYEMLKDDFSLPPVKIHLHKVVPIGAGLGGGSADGAFALKMLNRLFAIGLTDEHLRQYAARLGSDCPFFVANKPVLVSGKGEIFSPVTLDLDHYWLVLVYPDLHISTQMAYKGVVPAYPAETISQIMAMPIESWKAKLKNDFESGISARWPAITEIKETLYKAGAAYASMTGSGSTVYGIFGQKPQVAFPVSFKTWQGSLNISQMTPPF